MHFSDLENVCMLQGFEKWQPVLSYPIHQHLSFFSFYPLCCLDYSYWTISELWRSEHFDPASSPESALVLWHCRRSNGSGSCSACGPLSGRPVLQPKWTGGFRWGACVQKRLLYIFLLVVCPFQNRPAHMRRICDGQLFSVMMMIWCD